MLTHNLRLWARSISLFVFILLAAVVEPVIAQSPPEACGQGGTVTLPASDTPVVFTTITIQPGQSATLRVSGTGAFASGFIPGPGGGSVTTYQNTGTIPVTTQAAIVVETAGTFTWSLTGTTCAATAPSLDRWALWLLGAAFLLVGAIWRRSSARSAP